VILFQNRYKTILTPAAGWAIFARNASYPGNYFGNNAGASTPPIAAAMIPASLINPTNQSESCAALWAY
jgi:hypothetical protein